MRHIEEHPDPFWLNTNITPWFETMENDFDQFFQAVVDKNHHVCEELVWKGLDVNAKHDWKGQRSSALELASGLEFVKFLIELGETQD